MKKRTKPLRTYDLLEILGCSRHVLRGFLQELLPPKKMADKTGRGVGIKYSANSFLVIVICYEMEYLYGIRRSYLARLYPEILKEISKPRSLATSAKLTINFNPLVVKYEEGNINFEQGLLFPLMKTLKKIDEYLHSGMIINSGSDKESSKFDSSQMRDINSLGSASKNLS